MSVLEKPKRAAVVHEHIYLFIDLIGDGSGKRYEWEAANKIFHLAEARILMDLVSVASVSLNDPQVGIMVPERCVKFRVELKAEV